MTTQEDEGKIDIKKALRVFQVVLDKGELIDGEYHLEGLRADPGADGYTITLCNDYCTLVIQFHNNFTFDYWGDVERDKFLRKLDNIDRTHSSIPIDQ